MLTNILDKIVFGTLLLIFFQLPILSNEYLQLTNGYYLATKSQVDGYQLNAQRHGYTDVAALIEDLKRNLNPAVRTNAQQKEQTLREYDELLRALDILKNGNLWQKAVYMCSPERWGVLREVATNFQPGIPLSIHGFAYSLIGALLLGSSLMWPIRRIFGRVKRA